MDKTLHSQYYEPILKRLRKLRKNSGLTVRQLASSLKRDHNLVWRLENRERKIDLLEFYFYCKACNADPISEAVAIIEQIDHLVPQVSFVKKKSGRHTPRRRKVR